MNIKIADRLVELRKKNGLSQEQLADKLGLSRQAVSKWERAEASPDTDNLICLAKLYGVSLDELLDTDQSIEEIAQDTRIHEEEKRKDSVNIDDTGIHLKSADGDEVHIKNDGSKFFSRGKDDNDDEKHYSHTTKVILAVASGLTVFAALIAYILLGVYLKEPNGWAYTWMLFMLIPVVPSLIEAIASKKFTKFCYPVLVAAVYCFVGMWFNLWHPFWFLFLTIPVYYIIFNPIDEAIHAKDKKDEDTETTK